MKQKSKKQQKKSLCSNIIRIKPDQHNFNIFIFMHKIDGNAKNHLKKSLINKIQKRLLELKFKLDHYRKSKYCPKKLTSFYIHARCRKHTDNIESKK